MALHQCHRSNIACFMFLFIALVRSWSSKGFTYGMRLSTNDGDEIDCVDIYKQPAFDHPLLKNHTIQMKPNSFPSGLQATNSSKILKSWLKKIKCPKGTIPIQRTKAFNRRPVIPPIPNGKHSKGINYFIPPANYEFAQVATHVGRYYGARATFNIWLPNVVDPKESSVAQMWVLSGDRGELNAMEAGWESDGYQTTGCFNLDCPGFVQISGNYALGPVLEPTSTYGGSQYEIDVIIHKDTFNRNWWLNINGEEIGYWPRNLFTSLADSANVINIGGQVINNQYKGHHTTTQMGSGHFPNEGFGKAAYIGHISYVNNSSVLTDAIDLVRYAGRPACYDIIVGNDIELKLAGVHVFYGGLGFSNQCK
ncbi:hypothetical protein K2173_024388 [Erythroxylum novogranatense]|uniref:Neprosin PEP catalytic domain-containing protein n=1 Tax=Erythroxylum novogranatense TaxID=1862640 RepID=A0AAV8SUY0_9ROSI|nr:hypothetical protein K2173_024388 [Erythroxylum novogranatense]